MAEALIKEDTFRNHLQTVDQRGKRIWLYPKMPKGRYYGYRKLVSYLLLSILFITPWIKIGGEPLFMFNILETKFILFGVYFAPQDIHLFVVAMLILMLFVVLFTVVFGRVFCGWVCPQTIFMEMLFRRIEYAIEGDANAQRRLDIAPWNSDKFLKKGLKIGIFFFISVLIANTFLAYIIGIDEVIKIVTQPIAQHMSGFTAMLIFSGVFFFVFYKLREQVCTTICPYGRLQGVLLDEHSLAVQYDFVRGEPRGKISRKNPSADLGDCIDCNLCVQVCPTGIDIRNGIQLECINCTACMDACDEVMDKIDRPKGLIRIDSLSGIKDSTHQLINRRSVAYSCVLGVLILAEVFLVMSRTDVEILLLRTPGMLYQQTEEGNISNLYNYQLINKKDLDGAVEFKVLNEPTAIIKYVGEDPALLPEQVTEGALFIEIPTADIDNRKVKLKLAAYQNGELITEFKTNFLGPVK